MAIQSASAKLYTGIRCWCVDKNASANLVSTFSVGNKNRPIQPQNENVIYPNILADKVIRFVCDMEYVANISRTEERYKTYGGGNNIITWDKITNQPIIDNTNNWKVKFGLVCKFPTYVRIDLEKLQLPEGEDCIVEFEEGWLKEGDYPGSTYAPSPEYKNFFQFRMPYYGVAFLKSLSTINYGIQRIRPYNASITSSSTLYARGVFNPGKIAALEVGQFGMNAKGNYINSNNIITLYSFTGGGSQVWYGSFFDRIRSFSINISSPNATLITDFDIAILYEALLSDQFTIDIPTVEKFKGLVENYSSTSQLISSPIKTVSAKSQNNVISTMSIIIGKIKSTSSNNSILSSLSANINHIQRSPRWYVAGSMPINPATYTIPLSGNEFYIADATGSTTKLRKYKYGVLDQDAAGVSAAERRAIDIGYNGFWVVSNNNDAVDWGEWGTTQNPPKYLKATAVAVCKASGDKFALYDSTTARIKIYNTSGTQLTVYDTATLNISTPRFMQIQTISGNNILLVTTSSSGVRVMRYSTVWTVNTFSDFTNADRIEISNDGLMMAVSSNNNDRVDIFYRVSTSVGFVKQQTIYSTYSSMTLDRNKEFLFLDNRSYLWNGSSFQYVRDVGYPIGSGAFTFGSSTAAIQVISSTATEYYWQ